MLLLKCFSIDTHAVISVYASGKFDIIYFVYSIFSTNVAIIQLDKLI